MEGSKPSARCGHAMATIDRRVILFGGHSGNRECSWVCGQLTPGQTSAQSCGTLGRAGMHSCGLHEHLRSTEGTLRQLSHAVSLASISSAGCCQTRPCGEHNPSRKL